MTSQTASFLWPYTQNPSIDAHALKWIDIAISRGAEWMEIMTVGRDARIKIVTRQPTTNPNSPTVEWITIAESLREVQQPTRIVWAKNPKVKKIVESFRAYHARNLRMSIRRAELSILVNSEGLSLPWTAGVAYICRTRYHDKGIDAPTDLHPLVASDPYFSRLARPIAAMIAAKTQAPPPNVNDAIAFWIATRREFFKSELWWFERVDDLDVARVARRILCASAT